MKELILLCWLVLSACSLGSVEGEVMGFVDFHDLRIPSHFVRNPPDLLKQGLDTNEDVLIVLDSSNSPEMIGARETLALTIGLASSESSHPIDSQLDIGEKALRNLGESRIVVERVDGAYRIYPYPGSRHMWNLYPDDPRRVRSLEQVRRGGYLASCSGDPESKESNCAVAFMVGAFTIDMRLNNVTVPGLEKTIGGVRTLVMSWRRTAQTARPA
jgi:hypothetical protein